MSSLQRNNYTLEMVYKIGQVILLKLIKIGTSVILKTMNWNFLQNGF
jgi:hypothetical protein